MHLTERVAENLRALRLGSNMSQETLAARAGVSVSYISMMERGQRRPPLDTLELLARALGIPPLSLLEARPRRR